MTKNNNSDTLEPVKPSWTRRIIIAALRSPIGAILLLAFLYFAFQAYVLHASPAMNKLYMLGIVFLWLFWFVAKNIFKVVLLAVAIAYGAYSYHTYANRHVAQCEASGGYWNKQTQKCEEETGFWAGVFRRFNDLADYAAKGEENKKASN